MLLGKVRIGKRQAPRFALPPWNRNHPRWHELDQQLPLDHVARTIVAALEQCDWSALYACYSASGSPATDPVLMLRIVLIELRRGRFRPQHWYFDTLENDALKWAGFGIHPARTAWYDFHDRVAPLLESWNRQVVECCLAAQVTDGTRVSLDGSTVEANASRHRLVNEECLTRRQEQLAAACAGDEQHESVLDPPACMAKTPQTRREQQIRYERARQHLQELLASHQRQDACRRREVKKIVVSCSDPEAALGRDKFHIFRPLYNVQLVRDVTTALILAHDVLAQPTDAGTLKPMLRKLRAVTVLAVRELLVDAGYITAHHLALSAGERITLYGPWQANDYSSTKKEKQAEQKLLGKDQFTWDAEQQVYICPQGHRLPWIGRQRRRQADGEIHVQHSYRCSPEHCIACPLRERCTTNPKRGRSEHETLVESHRARMATDEAKKIYKQRKQTVELGFADLKEHRGLRRFPRRGLRRAQTQVGLMVLAHNLLIRYNACQAKHDSLNAPSLAA